jgi:DNA-binding phage protein
VKGRNRSDGFFFLGEYMKNNIKGVLKMEDKLLRKRVRILKATERVKNFYEVSEKIGLSRKGFYNWLNGQTRLGY